MSWRLLDSDPTVGRPALRISLVTLAVAAGWIAVALVVAYFIRNAYHSQGTAFFIRMFGGHTTRPLEEEYLARWRVFTISGLGAVFSAGAFLLIATRSQPRWLIRWGLPISAFLLGRALIWVGFAAAPVYEVYHHRLDGGPARFATSFDLDSWSRWDSFVYLSIAHEGYQFYPCDIPLEGAPIAVESNLSKGRGAWCGDAAWFPGYPTLIWVLARMGVPELVGGVLLSATFCVLTLFLLWTEFLGAELTIRGFLCMLFAALFPGAVYYHAVYPISMITFFVLLSLRFALRKQWKLCGVSGAAAAFTYPPGAFLGIVFLAWVLYCFRYSRWRDKLSWVATVGVMMSAGLALVFIVQRFFVGAWDAFFLSQVAYKELPRLPVASLLDSAKTLVCVDWAHRGPGILAAGTLFTSIVVVLLIAFAARAMRRSPVDAYLVVFLLVFWLALLTLGRESLIRKQALLLPAVALARHLPEWVLGALVVLALLLMPVLGMMFYSGLMS